MIKRRPRAIYSIIDLAEFIGQRSPASAERFMDATEATFKQIEAMPGLGRRYESSDKRLAGLRVTTIKGFPNHLVFYREFEKGIEVLHVLQGARDIDAVLTDVLREGEL